MKNKKVKINILFFSCLKMNENVSFFRNFFFSCEKHIFRRIYFQIKIIKGFCVFFFCL